MEELLAPYLRCTGKDRRLDAPAFSLALQGPEKLSRTAPYLFHVTLQRLDKDSKTCLFSWNPQVHGFLADGGFILLHHTAQGELRPVEFPGCNALPPLELWRSYPLNEHEPGGIQQYYDVFPERLLPRLQTGERYVLFWPGFYGYIPPAKTALVLPGGPFLSFTVEDDGDKPMAPAPLFGAEEPRPTLIARIECHPQGQVALKDDLVTATLHVTYERTGDGSGRPITFNTTETKPQALDMEGFSCGWGSNTFCDDPDIQVSPGSDDSFDCLHPGETWSNTFRYPMITDIESSDGGVAEAGELIRCLFKGIELVWWAWGTREDHLATVVTVPATGSRIVLEPRQHPVVIVPAAAPVDLKLV
ncbi:uncharacterized protein BO95DRAFT_455197 [Aspergillus brunneoviolaceus CBS 621.78]|uniref:Uncharacterized protein n=1 Tax=Aspergillus brunneoviolaceus CBS 621.78 TaxID=1450534 RepID=A0ACD1G207_9EURO|nr:hypothetical protein BO95DRAFT_455197 [Aspergillus brunneoviolaceus CBS 621.78]RAH43303.1 hypothetical protein BO95DRAFT_455197 [Aspergillus brunneoviolaceus CBS 621.78]